MAKRICRLDALHDPGTREFEPGDGRGFFIVRKGGQVFAYENSCPHTGATLNWLPHRFLARDSAHIQCDMHGAMFRIEDGACVFGPCAGRRLNPVPVRVADGDIVLEVDE